jgi:phage terminase large subunit-like protein
MGRPRGAGTPAASLAGLKIDAAVLAALSDDERALVTGQLREIEEAFRNNPLLGFRPHPRQIEFMAEPYPRCRLFLGGNRSGKTTAGMGYALVQCLPEELVPDHLQEFKRWGWDGPCFGRVITPDLTSTMEGVVLQKVRDWCPREALKGGSVDRAFDKLQRMLRFKNGSWIQFMSNDQDLDKFGGTALHWCLFDEEPRQDIYSECLMRLIDFGGEVLFTMTPLQGMSWIYDEFFEPWESGRGDDDVRIIVVDMDDNPHLSEDGKKIALQGLSSEERQARKCGRFVSFAGLIFPEYSSLNHVVPDEDELPENVECFEGLDPGMRHMAAVVFCYLDSDDRLVVYDELAVQGKTVADIAKLMKLKRAGWGVQPAWTVIDPAARNRNGQTGRSDQQEYLDCGIVAFPGQNDVRAGINRVRQRLEGTPPKLLISARCVELRSEIKKYRWMKDSKRTENAPAERPVKKDDHLLDALRYVVMHRPLAPNPLAPRESDTMKDRILRHHLKRLRKPPQRDSGFGPGIFA